MRPYNRDSDLLLNVDEVLVRFPDGDEQEVSVDGARRTSDAILMKLCSVDDRTRAEGLRGAVLCVRRRAFPPLEQGEFYVCDVEGARVFLDDATGARREVGRVLALRSYPTADVLVVASDDGGRPWEVPLVGEVVRSVDVSAGIVELWTMDGVERG